MRRYEEKFNWTHNPYIRANVYDVQGGSGYPSEVKLSENIWLKECTEEDTKFLPGASEWLRNSLCFNDLSKINLTRSWVSMAPFKNIMISIDEC